ncbi:MAG: hypothetical protein ACJ71Z_06010 [Aeromicrobium sp.]
MKTFPQHPDRPPDAQDRLLDASLHLLNRTVTDRNDVPIGIVDDLEIDLAGAGRPVITHLDVSSGVLAPLRRGRGRADLTERVQWGSIAAIEAALRLTVSRDDVKTTERERWLRKHVISHIPGGRHDPE